MSATREIIGAILASPVPVVVFVAPSGARAASAGTYIALRRPRRGDGAGHPSRRGHAGSDRGAPPGPGAGAEPRARRAKSRTSDQRPRRDGTQGVNDAVAYLRSLAQLRGRNAEWAEKAVRDGGDADGRRGGAARKVIDLLADNVGDLLDQLDGRTVRTADGERVLDHTPCAVVLDLEPDWRTRLLAVVTDPNVAFMLLLIGVYGIIFEFWHPGLVVPGMVGAICLLLAL